MEKKELKKKIISYSSIAAGALAMASQAEAAVVYSGPQNIVVNASNPVGLIDIDNDGNTDFAVYNLYNIAHIIYGNGQIIQEPLPPYTYPILVVNLPNGYNIDNTLGAGRYWIQAPPVGVLDVNYPGTGGYYGNFIGKTGYIGVRFNATCGTAYGWIQYRANNDATEGTIIDWAYEDTCQPIKAGDKGQQVAIPALTPAGIAIAAGLLSGVGIRALRKKKKEEKA